MKDDDYLLQLVREAGSTGLSHFDAGKAFAAAGRSPRSVASRAVTLKNRQLIEHKNGLYFITQKGLNQKDPVKRLDSLSPPKPKQETLF